MVCKGFRCLVEDMLRVNLSEGRARTLKSIVKSESGIGDISELAGNDPAKFEELLTQICGNTAYMIYDDIIQELYQTNLPFYDISEYGMRCDSEGQFASSILEYRNLEYIRRIIFYMKDRDHIAHNFATRVSHDHAVFSFIMRGQANNQLNILIINSQEERAFERLLGYNDIESDSPVDPSRILLVRQEDLYPENLGSSFQPVLNQLIKSQELAKSRGFSGLNVIGTIAGNLALDGRFEKCITLEKSWDEVIRMSSLPITLLCPYQSGVVTGQTELQLVSCHNKGFVHH